MAYNTRAIKLDVNSKPIPQYYNAEVDDYEVLQGKNGANRVMLYDANGNPLLTSANPGYVRAADGAITALGALADAAQADPAAAASVIALLKGLLTKLANPATEATLAQVKAVLDTINTSTDGLEALLTAIRDTAGIKKVVDPVDVSDRSARQLGQVTLSGSNEQVKIIDASSSTQVAAGAAENINIYAPAGKIDRLLGLELFTLAPAGAISGTHLFDVYLSGYIRLMGCVYGYNNFAQFAYSSWRGTPSSGSPFPSDAAAIVAALCQAEFSSAVPLLIRYSNNTDKPQTSARIIKLVVLERGGQ